MQLHGSHTRLPGVAPQRAMRTARCGAVKTTTSKSVAGTAKSVAGTKTVRGGTQTGTRSGTQTVKGGTQSGRGSIAGKAPGGTTAVAAQPKPAGTGSRFYFNITGFPFPIGPFFSRKTVRTEVEKGTIWTFEQTQSFPFAVFTPVRMTVIKLKSGGLWVHAPVAPTEECLRLLKELNAPVEYIVLPTFAYEHKIYVGPFARKFPDAQVYVTPEQWSFPLNLPNQFFGINPDGELTSDDPEAPWADEIGQKLFSPPSVSISDSVKLTECAFFHRRTRTLLVTDAVVYVEDKPPESVPEEALLEQGQDGWLAKFLAGGRSREEIAAVARPGVQPDTPETRSLGWKRMSLLVLYFNPADLLKPQASFDAISNRLFVGPVVETLVYSKCRAAVREWVDSIVEDWDFKQIIPCHFKAPVRAGPADFKRAFAFAYEGLEEPAAEAPKAPEGLFGQLAARLGLDKLSMGAFGKEAIPAIPERVVEFPEADIKVLRQLDALLVNSGAVKANVDP